MSNYFDEREPNDLEIKQGKARALATILRERSAGDFTITELHLLLHLAWDRFKSDYTNMECEEIFNITQRLGIKR